MDNIWVISYFWDLENYPPRKVVGFPTLDDLERLYFIRQHRKPLADELINTEIAGRDYQIRAIRAVLEAIEMKKRDFLLVMANPPFTGSIDKGDINENLSLKTTKTELLFTETIYRLLKKGGTAGVIVPQGVLFGSARAFAEARKILVERCDLKAVVTMPSGVFKPYAGVSTAILIFTKVYDKEEKVTEPGPAL